MIMNEKLQSLRKFAANSWAFVSKIWTPVLVDEGELIPKWYGISQFIPYPYHNPHINPNTFRWQKVAYPIPTMLVLAFWYWLERKLKIGFAVPPELYRNKIFEIKTQCPHCDKNVYDFIPPYGKF